jgi:hypothetical protein
MQAGHLQLFHVKHPQQMLAIRSILRQVVCPYIQAPLAPGHIDHCVKSPATRRRGNIPRQRVSDSTRACRPVRVG